MSCPRMVLHVHPPICILETVLGETDRSHCWFGTMFHDSVHAIKAIQTLRLQVYGGFLLHPLESA